MRENKNALLRAIEARAATPAGGMSGLEGGHGLLVHLLDDYGFDLDDPQSS